MKKACHEPYLYYREIPHEGYYREIGLFCRDMEFFGEDMGLPTRVITER